MKITKVSYFIAKKLGKDRQLGQVGLSVKIATASIIISIIVMIISSAVVYGFRSDISKRIFDFTSDFQIVEASNYSYSNNYTISTTNNYIEQIQNLDYIDHVSQFAFKTGIVKGAKEINGVMMKGVGSDFDWSKMERYILEGEVLNTSDSLRYKRIFVSKKIVDKLSLSLGDRVEVVYFDSVQRRDLFTVGGIYQTLIPEIDNRLVLCDIRDIQRVNSWNKDVITGYDIALKTSDRYHEAKEDIDKILYLSGPSNYRTETLVDTRVQYDSVFGWFDMIQINELVIFIIMVIVSIFNVISMLLTILMQKTSMIGILKSLGMRDLQIQSIFLFRGVKELFVGVLIGNIVGVSLCYLQSEFGLIKLDGASYMVSQVPIDLGFSRVVYINIMLLASLIFFQFLATFVVTKMQPYKAIKYEKR